MTKKFNDQYSSRIHFKYPSTIHKEHFFKSINIQKNLLF